MGQFEGQDLDIEMEALTSHSSRNHSKGLDLLLGRASTLVFVVFHVSDLDGRSHGFLVRLGSKGRGKSLRVERGGFVVDVDLSALGEERTRTTKSDDASGSSSRASQRRAKERKER